MRKPSLLILSFICIYLSAFFLWGGPVKIIWSFSSFGEDDYFFRPSDIEVDHQRSLIYVADAGSHRILVFDLQGKLQSTIGNKGQGPGEFSNPTGIDILDEGGLAVADFGSNRIQIFDKSGEFIRSIKTKEVRVADIMFIDERIYAVSSFGASGYGGLNIHSNEKSQPLVIVLDGEGNVVSDISIEDFPETHPFIRAIKHRVCLTFSNDQKFFLPFFAMNLIHVFDLEGNKVAEFNRPLPFKPIVPKLLQQRESKEGVISMAATMDLITRDAEIGPDGHLYLLTHKDSFSERIKGKDVKDLGRLLPPPMRIDVIDTDTHEVIRHVECDPGAKAFAVIDKDRLVYIYEDSEGELIFKCIQY